MVPVQTCVGAAPPVGEAAAVAVGRQGKTCFWQPGQQRSGADRDRAGSMGGGGPPFGPQPVSLAAQMGVTTLSANTGLPLNAVGTQTSVQFGVNH